MMNANLENRTTITDVDIPFGRLVMILLKLMVASIPAVMVFYAVLGGFILIFAVVFGGGAALLQGLSQ